MVAMKAPRICPAVLAVLVISTLLYAGDKKNNGGQFSSVKFVVLKDDNGKPVRNAAVILHLVKRSGEQANGGFELKTNSEGQTESDGIPYGTLRVQVIAPEFQTFGADFTID